MRESERLWQEAAALLQGEVDADLRMEAREVFWAEAARCRLVDRRGPAQVRLQCGQVLVGDLTPEQGLADCLALADGQGRVLLLPVAAVVLVVGSASSLREETARRVPTLGQWLREAWADGGSIRALDATGTWNVGPVAFVGADHVVLEAPADGSAISGIVLPWGSVQAWTR